jgi:hypothetical protein
MMGKIKQLDIERMNENADRYWYKCLTCETIIGYKEDKDGCRCPVCKGPVIPVAYPEHEYREGRVGSPCPNERKPHCQVYVSFRKISYGGI